MTWDATRSSFLNLAGLLQGGLTVAAILLAAFAGLAPLAAIHWNMRDGGIALLAVVPMLLLFMTARGLRRLVVDALGPALSRCTWYDLLLLAALAGFGEELLFRGVLEPWIGRLHPWAGTIAANLAFGLLHALTPLYALVATLIGFYMSWLNYGVGEPNLLRPIVAHAAYDYVAFLWVTAEYRRRRIDDPPRPPQSAAVSNSPSPAPEPPPREG